MGYQILHIGTCDKFIPPFVKVVEENFDFEQHDFHIRAGMADEQLKLAHNVCLYKRTIVGLLNYYLKSIVKMQQA